MQSHASQEYVKRRLEEHKQKVESNEGSAVEDYPKHEEAQQCQVEQLHHHDEIPDEYQECEEGDEEQHHDQQLQEVVAVQKEEQVTIVAEIESIAQADHIQVEAVVTENRTVTPSESYMTPQSHISRSIVATP